MLKNIAGVSPADLSKNSAQNIGTNYYVNFLVGLGKVEKI